MTLAQWVAQRIKPNSEVSLVEVLSESLMRIKRIRASDVLVGTVAESTLSQSALKAFLATNPGVAFVMNVPKDSTFADDAKIFAKEAHVGLGHLGDLRHALRLGDPAAYVDQPTTFAEVSLSAHSRVASTLQLDDGRWLIRRRGLPDVIIVYLYQYDFSADSVHTAIAAHGPFQAIVKTNPNGNISILALQAASNAGRRIFRWGEFLKELNKPWT